MSREQVFVLAALVAAGAAQVVVDAGLWALGKEAVKRSAPAPGATPSQTRSNLGPVFQCTGAGAEVVVSLGGDGKSIFWTCNDVKP